MKLITWNIQFGLGVDGRLDLARIIAHARSMADFDVLCLQEVADNFPDLQQGGSSDQFAQIAALLPDYESIEGPGVDVPDGKGGRRRFGNMMLSRYPVGRIFRHALPWVTDGSRSMPRLLIDAVVQAPWGPLRVMTTHLEYYSPLQRIGQVETIRRAVQEGRGRAGLAPVQGPGGFAPTDEAASAILTADFNMIAGNPTFQRLLQPADDGAPGLIDAWSALHPNEAHPFSFCIYDQRYDQPHCCDFILLTPDLKPRLRRVFYDTQTQLSDHQPVLIELDD
ncbi:MAG: endonuclease [Alphaproteobacteria bacterium]|jgi:endonuclease/exonuclease/phosphatase family metal-dependent hydrolase|nr:endonuclease [Alphaproteobacteria bacterium]